MKPSFQNLLPFAGMIVTSCLATATRVISKAAMSRGMSSYVFNVYSIGLGALLFLPALFSSLMMDRHRPSLSFRMMWKFFFLGLLGVTLGPNLALAGIKFSSPTLASAISNLDPALTSLLAVIFRIEKFDIKCFRSQIKILGTIVLVMGALTMTLYRGPVLWTSLPSDAVSTSTLPQILLPHSSWVLGGFCFVVSSFSSSGSNVLQASVLKTYPFETTVVFFTVLTGTIQNAAMSLIIERDRNAWKLNFDIELVSVVCVAVFTSVAAYIVAWCIGKKGPVFVAMFGPMGIVITAPISAIFLGENLYVGSIVGAVIIVSGFYAVIWAQAKDKENDRQCLDHLPSSSSQKIPLLQQNC